ncbi:MAG: SusD/RagB family nutrient-binding outer membrane lipoprotein [Saprospiraceae bacterium]
MLSIYKYILLILPPLLLFSACEEFTDFNENLNEPTTVSADVLLTSSQRQAMNTLVTESFLLGNNIAQLTAKTLRTEVDSYNWNAFPTVWEGLYESLTDIQGVRSLAEKSGDQALEGVAIVWQTFIFSVLTNAYGDIPYFEAIKGNSNNFTPSYDAQADIYADMLQQLATANDLLAEGGIISGDIIYNGNATQWQKLANSLRLRLIMGANQQLPDAAAAFKIIVENFPIIDNNEASATLTYLNGFPNQYPLIPLKTGDFDAVNLSQTALDAMQETADPRLLRYARPSDDDYNKIDALFGAFNGSNTSECTKNGSRLGAQYWNDPNQIQANDLGLNAAEGIIMTYAEVQFLLAEATAKGWLIGDAAMFYNQGIAASMEYYNVDYAAAGWEDFNDYYTNSGVAYQGVKDIWEQKWLALFFHGLEPYFELRRWYHESGMDWADIPFLNAPCSNINNDELPLRFLYPGEEQSLNRSNYVKAVERLGDNSQNAKMWLVQ